MIFNSLNLKEMASEFAFIHLFEIRSKDALFFHCDALHDLVPFVQFKKLEKHKSRKWYQIAQNITFTSATTASGPFFRCYGGLSFV